MIPELTLGQACQSPVLQELDGPISPFGQELRCLFSEAIRPVPISIPVGGSDRKSFLIPRSLEQKNELGILFITSPRIPPQMDEI